MATVIACQALIMPALLRRPQYAFKGGRARPAVRVHCLRMRRSHFRSSFTVAAQTTQQDAATPHQINEPGAKAASIEHISSDRSDIDESVDIKSSNVDLMNLWRRLADAAAALTVIMALMLAPLSGSAWAARSGGRMGGSSFSAARSSSGSGSRSFGGGSSGSSYSGGSSRSSYSSGSSSTGSSGGGSRTDSSTGSSTPSFASRLGRSSSSSGGSSSTSSSVTVAPSTSYYSSAPWAGSSSSRMTSAQAVAAADRPMTEAEARASGSVALAYLLMCFLFLVWKLVGWFWRGRW